LKIHKEVFILEIKKIFAKFNGNPKVLDNRKQLIEEYKSYTHLHSLQLRIATEKGEIELSLISACHFIVTGEIQENLLKKIKNDGGFKNG
jgi:hypothetical protein